MLQWATNTILLLTLKSYRLILVSEDLRVILKMAVCSPLKLRLLVGRYAMNYYDYRDFEDHFWSPQEVCGQAPETMADEDWSGLGQWLGKQIRLMLGS